MRICFPVAWHMRAIALSGVLPLRKRAIWPDFRTAPPLRQFSNASRGLLLRAFGKAISKETEIDLQQRRTRHSVDAAFFRRSKNAGRIREGLGPFEFQSWQTACTATTGAVFSTEKSLPCRFCGRNPQDFRKIWRGWPWRGACFPVRQLVKKTFLTSCVRFSELFEF